MDFIVNQFASRTMALEPNVDLVQPFLIELSALRGRLVRLGPALQTILTQHDYPPVIATLLGEALLIAVCLSAALKFEGIFTLQIKGAGPVKLIVADLRSDGALRGYAQYDAATLPAHSSAALPDLLGQGYLAFTVDQGPDTERYQAIVALEGDNLSAAIEHYFRQSEQIEAMLRCAVAYDHSAGGWHGSALMLQRVPESGGHAEPDARGLHSGFSEAAEEDWRRAQHMLGSLGPSELIDPTLAPNRLLYRLFHEDGVRTFPPQSLRAQCRCSAERVGAMLTAWPAAELADMMIDGVIAVTCEFCNRHYHIDKTALATSDVMSEQ